MTGFYKGNKNEQLFKKLYGNLGDAISKLETFVSDLGRDHAMFEGPSLDFYSTKQHQT